MYARKPHESVLQNCQAAVYDLLQEIIDIKSSWPEYKDLLSHPKVNNLMRHLDKLTDQLMFAGGL